MVQARRPGFVAAPKLVFPALLLIVVVMFFVFASVGGQGVSDARIAAAAIVGTAIILLFAILAVLSRLRGRDATAQTTASSRALLAP